MTVKETVDSAIADNKITVFSKSWCPYSNKAKALLAKEFPDVKAEVLELDEREDGDAIQTYLHQKTGQRTVPNIFINNQHIGGSDDLAASHRAGRLRALVTSSA